MILDPEFISAYSAFVIGFAKRDQIFTFKDI